MADIPQHWRDYMRLQTRLSQTKIVDSSSWGREAALNALLQDQQKITPDVDKIEASAARRERNHKHIDLHYLFPSSHAFTLTEPAIHATIQLSQIRAKTLARDWKLLLDIGCGAKYSELSGKFGRTVGAVRVRVNRLRASLHQLHHAA